MDKWFRGWVWSVLLSLLTWACHPKLATRPLIHDQASVSERRALYRDYQLRSVDKGLGGTAFQRADGTYHAPQLKNVAAAYPETRELYSDSSTRSVALTIPAVAGGFGVGYVLGDAIGAGKLDETTSNVMLYGGLGLIGLTLLVSVLWDEPMDEFASVYNSKLQDELGVEGEVEQSARIEISPTGYGILIAY